MTHDAGGEPLQNLPDFDKVHTPDLEEVLGRLANGTLGEVSDPKFSSDGVTVVFLGRPAPEASDDVYASAQGDIVYPFARKFDRGSERWQLGDVVRQYLI